MSPDVARRIEGVSGRRIVRTRKLAGGCVGEVMLVEFEGGGRVVAKLGPGLEPEGWMLRVLASRSRLPVPHVVHAEDSLLLMEYVPGGGSLDASAQVHAAELLAALHSISWHAYGMERDTLIGGLAQPNPPTASWVDFFRDHRLLYMAHQAHGAGRLPAAVLSRIETLAGRLERWIDQPARPSLIHGDCWAGNVLVRDGRVAAFIDPALSFADAEIELAFGTMFGTFGEPFFLRYHELSPIDPAFHEARRELYTLYPLLVHVRLFGGSYVAGVEGVLDRFLG